MGSRFKILGHTQLLLGGHFNGQWGTPKQRGVLGALLLRPREPVPTDDLVDWVWPPDTEPRPKSSTFHTYASKIRDHLKLMDRPPDLYGERGAYVIDVPREEVDAVEFRDLLRGATQLNERHEHAEAQDMLRSIVDSWSRPLADLEGDRAQNWRTMIIDNIWLPAQYELMRALSALGEFGDVLRLAAELPPDYLTRLPVIQGTLEALYGLHRGRDATEFFLRMRKRLVADGDQIAADALKNFHDTLLLATDLPVIGDATADHRSRAPAAHRPRHIPHDIPSLVGRAELLDQLDAATATGAVVMLEGQPGIGKTALAIRWAHRAAERFPDGQFWGDLDSAGDERHTRQASVVDKLLAALGVAIEKIPTATGRAIKLGVLLSNRQAVVILDNVSTTEQVMPLLEALPCAVVVISRRHLSNLHRHGATSLPVPPLPQPDAARWLADRIGPRAITEPGDITTLVDLCGGNALILHLVAEHVVRGPRVPLADFVEELRDPATLLELGNDADDPTGSLGAALSAAYRALAPEQRRLFTLLGVHPGPDISVAAAAAIAGQEERAVGRVLDDLVKAYLLTQPEVRGRYRFHDLIRSFAALRVADDEERTAAEQRMLNFYFHGAQAADAILFDHLTRVPDIELLDGVEPTTFHGPTAAIKWCATERDVLHSMIELAGRRHFGDYAKQLPQSIGETFMLLGYFDQAMAGLNVAIEAAEAAEDLEAQAASHQNLGYVHVERREFEQARFHLTLAHRLHTETGDRVGAATARYNLARAQVEQGEYRAGIDGLNEALHTFRELDEPGAEAKTLLRLAHGYRRSGDRDRAISHAQEGHWLAEKIENEVLQGDILAELSAAYLEKGDWASAKGYAERSLAITVRISSLAGAAQASMVLAAVHHEHGEPETVERHLRSAIHFAKGLDRITEAAALGRLAEMYFKQARHEEAIDAGSAALAIFEDIGDSRMDFVRSLLEEARIAFPTATPKQSRQTSSLAEPRIGSPPIH